MSKTKTFSAILSEHLEEIDPVFLNAVMNAESEDEGAKVIMQMHLMAATLIALTYPPGSSRKKFMRNMVRDFPAKLNKALDIVEARNRAVIQLAKLVRSSEGSLQ